MDGEGTGAHRQPAMHSFTCDRRPARNCLVGLGGSLWISGALAGGGFVKSPHSPSSSFSSWQSLVKSRTRTRNDDEDEPRRVFHALSERRAAFLFKSWLLEFRGFG